MSNFPRRSPRFQSQAQPSQPAFSSTASFTSISSQSSSATLSSHPSPTNDPLTTSAQSRQYPLQVQSQFLAPIQTFNAPLPSPSANDINPFACGQLQPQFNMGGQAQSQSSESSYHNNNSNQSQAFGQQTKHHNSLSQPQRPNYPPTSINGVPPGLPPDFLAEAAKRAQMACLMRDLDDVSL